MTLLRFLSTLVLSSLLLKTITAQSSCQNFDSAEPVSSDDDKSVPLQSVDTGFIYKSRGDYRIPRNIHWHIYASENFDEPRYSVTPTGYLEPKVSSQGRLRFTASDNLEILGYQVADRVSAGINVYVPLNQLEKLYLTEGIEQSFEVIIDAEPAVFSTGNETVSSPFLSIDFDGIENRLYVNAPDVQVDVQVSGIDCKAIMEIGEDSSVSISGTDQYVEIKADQLSSLDIAGISNKAIIEGGFDRVSVSGINADLSVVGDQGCNDVTVDLDDAQCNSVSDESVTVPDLSCLTETRIVDACDGGEICVELSPGASVAIFTLVLLCCVGSCGLIGYVCGCWRSKSHRENYDITQPTTTAQLQPQLALGQENHDAYQPTPGMAVAQAVPLPLPMSSPADKAYAKAPIAEAKPY